MAPTYPATAERLLDQCRTYKNGEADLEILKAQIWQAAAEVSIPHERGLREFLQRAEGKLDMIQHTIDEDEVAPASLEIVKAIEAKLIAYLTDTDAESAR